MGAGLARFLSRSCCPEPPPALRPPCPPPPPGHEQKEAAESQSWQQQLQLREQAQAVQLAVGRAELAELAVQQLRSQLGDSLSRQAIAQQDLEVGRPHGVGQGVAGHLPLACQQPCLLERKTSRQTPTLPAREKDRLGHAAWDNRHTLSPKGMWWKAVLVPCCAATHC